jgi:phenylalanyl-tRNA synthetase beta chain
LRLLNKAMKISYNWLKTKLDLTLTPEELSVLLTDCGLEVESVDAFESVKGGLRGVVVGEVKEKEKHPDADRLSLTKVDIGTSELLSIVCGAPNVAAGQKVLVATIGTTLYPSTGEPITMKKSKIRGQVSEGMICAEDELGLGQSHDGILVLPEDTIIGTSAADIFNIENDYVFEIGLTANRPDAASHFGTAKDVAAVLNTRVGELKYQVKAKLAFTHTKSDTALPIQVKIGNDEACKRYAGVVLNSIRVTSSPQWLQNRLLAIGVRPINNVVDITNYVLHDLGQPLHAFDYSKINQSTIKVRLASVNEKMVTLDGQSRALQTEDLLIADAENGLCIAGVFGGQYSGVNENTTTIFLESAYFDPTFVRKTASHLGLKTDASYRFERGTDVEMVLPALNLAISMMAEICGAKVSSEIIDVYKTPIEPFKVSFSYSKCDQLIGNSIPHNTVKLILESLGIVIKEESSDALLLEVPMGKVDVTREADIVEEILRVYGQNNISIPEKLNASLSYRQKPDVNDLENKTANYLVNNGFYECQSISLGSSDFYINNAIHNDSKSVKVMNGLSPDHNTMRQTLLFSMLENAAYNQKRKQNDLKLFEFGNVYFRNDALEMPYEQNRQLALLISGQVFPENAYGFKLKANFDVLKSYALQVLNNLGIVSIQLKSLTDHYFSQGIQVYYKKHLLADLGAVAKPYLKQCDVNGEAFVVLMHWDTILNVMASLKNIEYSEVSKFPSVRRDLALIIDKHIQYAELERIATETERKYLQSTNLFDIYEGDKIEAGKKSYALSFIFQDQEATLTDKQIDQIMSKLLKAFEDKAGAKLR